MSPIRTARPTTIRDLQQADGVLEEIARLRSDIETLEEQVQHHINRVRSEAAARMAPIQERLNDLEAGLKHFAWSHREELFHGRKRVELIFGTFGWRNSARLQPGPKTTWSDIRDRIKNLGMHHGLRIREDVDRTALRKWSDEELNRVGVHRTHQAIFWYLLHRNDSIPKALRA